MFDTNVLVSGYLWTGPARRALDKARSGESTLLESIEELIRILAYDKFGLEPDEIEPIIQDLTQISEYVGLRTQLQIIKDDPANAR